MGARGNYNGKSPWGAVGSGGGSSGGRKEGGSEEKTLVVVSCGQARRASPEALRLVSGTPLGSPLPQVTPQPGYTAPRVAV